MPLSNPWAWPIRGTSQLMFSTIRSLARRGAPPRTSSSDSFVLRAQARPRHLRRGAGGDSRRDYSDSSRVHNWGAPCNGHLRTYGSSVGTGLALSFLVNIEGDSILGPIVGSFFPKTPRDLL